MRTVLFYILLLIPIILWIIVVIPAYASALRLPDYSTEIVYATVSASPFVGGDISIFGEVTPIILAGLILALMPKSSEINYFAIILAIVSYALFIQLSVFFSPGGPGVGLISANWDGEQFDKAQKTILGVVSNLRMTMIVIAASILGFKVKGGNIKAG